MLPGQVCLLSCLSYLSNSPTCKYLTFIYFEGAFSTPSITLLSTFNDLHVITSRKSRSSTTKMSPLQPKSKPIPPPSPAQILPPLLSSLPAATVSPIPPTALLPLLSPILRQRVTILSSASKEPWLPLLCYDSTKATKLTQIATSERFELHPVSGEVEIDCEDVGIQFKRIDPETLRALLQIREVGLAVWCLWCTDDPEGGLDDWRIGEVSAFDEKDAHWGFQTVSEAESAYTKDAQSKSVPLTNGGGSSHAEEVAEDDDAYWAQYDNTPAQTPAIKQAPAPASTGRGAGLGEEDAYYAQYAQVQPAMDNHDPDEAAQNGHVESTLGQEQQLTHEARTAESQQHWLPHTHPRSTGTAEHEAEGDSDDENAHIMSPSPRPSSSGSSSGSRTVARLEKTVEAVGRSEIGVRQHISTTVKSLYRLARAAGMERGEFEEAVRRELDVLGMMEEDE